MSAQVVVLGALAWLLSDDRWRIDLVHILIPFLSPCPQESEDIERTLGIEDTAAASTVLAV